MKDKNIRMKSEYEPFSELWKREMMKWSKKMLVDHIKTILKDRKTTWFKSSEILPDENVSVLVFIPEEDNHITAGMWDISQKWVLLDEYRVPISEVTYWSPFPQEPEDRDFESKVDEVQLNHLDAEIRSIISHAFLTDEVASEISRDNFNLAVNGLIKMVNRRMSELINS